MGLIFQLVGAVAASTVLTYFFDAEPETPLEQAKSQLTLQNVAAALGIFAAGLTIYKFYRGRK